MPSPTLSKRFDEALAFASNLHRSQTRKGTEIPYISHLLAVAAIVIEHGGDETQTIAALLHDAAEDQGGEKTLAEIKRRFGSDVAQIVSDCTDAWTDPKPEWRSRKETYLAHLGAMSPQSLLVSLADKVHNARTIVEDRRTVGEDIWRRFTGKRDGTLWYYRSLSHFFLQNMPGLLANEFARTVLAMSNNEANPDEQQLAEAGPLLNPQA